MITLDVFFLIILIKNSVLSLEDRKRAQHLLAITQPANHEFTILREAKPAILTKKGEFVAGSTDCKPREYLVPNLKGGSSVSQSADGDKSIVYGKCSQCKVYYLN